MGESATPGRAGRFQWRTPRPCRGGPQPPGLGRKGKGGMFSGEYRHNMDPKGRVTVPSKFRDDLGERFYVCKGLDGCLFVLSQEQWDKLVEKVSAMPLAQGKGIQRYFFSGAAEVEPDKQGRVLIPPNLREHAGLQKDVTLIGAATRAEIWDTERWEAYNNSQTEEDLQEAMNCLSF